MNLIDLTGQRFDKLLVLGLDPEHRTNPSGKIVWKCQCDCGTIVYKTRDSLMRPLTTNVVKACSKQCGAIIPNGTRFTRLVVLDTIIDKNNQPICLCQCDCGKQIMVPPNRLKLQQTKSCGCYKIERMSEIGKANSYKSDITNKRFGRLIAIEPTEKRLSRSVVWKCQCDCGNIYYTSVSRLNSGHTVQCDKCKTISKGEDKIKKILETNNINFEQEKSFNTCRSPLSNHLLYFDFYVDNKYLIEFDGKQYFQVNGWYDSHQLKDSQIRDNYKNQWCKTNNIPLIRIPYTELEFLDIKDLKLETTKFLI